MAKSSYQQEAERRANDLLRVYNPTDKDYVIEWDRRDGVKLFRVPAKEEAVLIRYIAEKYMREMYQKMVNAEVDEKILEENKKRKSSGMSEMDKTLKSGEQMSFEAPLLNKTPEEQREILSVLYVGIESEYGLDRAIKQEEEEKSKSFGDVMDEVQKEKGTTIASIPSEASQKANGEPVEAKKEESGDKNTFRCDYPNCNFSSEHRVALMGHKKSHKT